MLSVLLSVRQPSQLAPQSMTTAFLQEGNPNECQGYDIKQSDREGPVMLELWGMLTTLSLLSLPDPLWPGVITTVRVLSMAQSV